MIGFLVPGLKEIVVIAVVALALYGRGGSRLLRATRYGRTIEPWLDMVRVPSPADKGKAQRPSRPTPPNRKRRSQGRLFWALALTAAAAVAAWVATRIIVSGGGPKLYH